jgi:protein TonB
MAPAPDSQRHLPALPPVPERSSSVPPEEPLRVGGEVVRPEVLKRVQPDLSKLQNRRIRLPGTPIYEVTITAKGDVANVRVIRSNNLDIDAAVIAALRQWKFRPATRNGKPVAVYYTLTVNIDVF